MGAIEQVHYPDKLFYRIQEVSTISGVKPYVLRYWETEFPMLSPEKDENEQRRYRRSDIDLILEIKRLLYQEKFTIAGARRRLKQGLKGGEVRAAGTKGGARGEVVSAGPAAVVDVRPYSRLATSVGELRREVAEVYKLFR